VTDGSLTLQFQAAGKGMVTYEDGTDATKAAATAKAADVAVVFVGSLSSEGTFLLRRETDAQFKLEAVVAIFCAARPV
jgi:hypothetical protein